MDNELTEKCYAGSVCWIVPVDQLKVGIGYQRHRARCEIVVRIHNPARCTELHKCVANRIRWRGERWQITEHPAKMSGQRWIRRRCVSGVRARQKPKAGEPEGDEKPEASEHDGD
jgi:hypothetical protein